MTTNQAPTIDPETLHRMNGFWMRQPGNPTGMEQAMLDAWGPRADKNEPWREGECRVCARPIQDCEAESVDVMGETLEIAPTVCDDCEPIMEEHYGSPRKIERSADALAEWQAQCPKLYQDVISGDVTPENISWKLVDRVKSWDVGPTGMLILGASGTGKTTALWALARELAKREITYSYWSAIELGKELSKCAKDLAHSYHLTRKRVLLIDDLGKERITNSAASLWWELINRRYEQRLPVIITTRFSGNGFEQRMGAPAKAESGPDMGEHVIAGDIRRRLGDMCKVIQAGGER